MVGILNPCQWFYVIPSTFVSVTLNQKNNKKLLIIFISYRSSRVNLVMDGRGLQKVSKVWKIHLCRPLYMAHSLALKIGGKTEKSSSNE